MGETTRRRGCPSGGGAEGNSAKSRGITLPLPGVSPTHTCKMTCGEAVSHSVRELPARSGSWRVGVPQPEFWDHVGACGTETRWGLQPLLNRLPAYVDQTMSTRFKIKVLK